MIEDGPFRASMCQPKSTPAFRVCSSMSSSKDGLKVRGDFVAVWFWLHVCILVIVNRKVKLREVQIAEFLTADFECVYTCVEGGSFMKSVKMSL